MSAAVHTAITPGSARAADVSIEAILPWACCARTIRICSWCTKEISAEKRPPPLTNGRARRRLEGGALGRTSGEQLLRLGDPSRLRFDPAQRHARLADHPALQAKCDERHAEGKIAGPAIELVEAEARVGGKDGKTHFDQKL